MSVPKLLRFALLMGSILLLASCATQPIPDAIDPPGFFTGFWHGLTAVFAVIGHLFDDSIRVYAFPNSGGWYDFGFLLGVCTLAGGGGASTSSSDGDDDKLQKPPSGR
jgi:hypothetical protein